VYQLARGDSAFAQLAEQAAPVVDGGESGRLRVAAAQDRALLAGWLAAFAAESRERIGSPEALADDLISYGGAAFWEVPDRVPGTREAAHFLAVPQQRDTPRRAQPAYFPVAMAVVTRPVAGTVRISVVYTDPEHRRQGHAAALTLAVTLAVLTDSEQVLGQPSPLAKAEQVILITENRQERTVFRLGYHLVDERAVLRFGPQTGPLPKLRTGPMPRLPSGPLQRLPTGPPPRFGRDG
jgi:hypothetical protein